MQKLYLKLGSACRQSSLLTASFLLSSSVDLATKGLLNTINQVGVVAGSALFELYNCSCLLVDLAGELTLGEVGLKTS